MFHVEQKFKQIPSWNISRAARDTAPAPLPPYNPPPPPPLPPLTLLNWPRQYGTVRAHALWRWGRDGTENGENSRPTDKRYFISSSGCEPDTWREMNVSPSSTNQSSSQLSPLTAWMMRGCAICRANGESGQRAGSRGFSQMSRRGHRELISLLNAPGDHRHNCQRNHSH